MSLSCPYYTEDEIAKDFPLNECDHCEHIKRTDDEEAIMYCEVSSDPNAFRRSSRIKANKGGSWDEL